MKCLKAAAPAAVLLAMFLSGCSNSVADDAALQAVLDAPQPMGSDVTQAEADDWYNSIYGVPTCPDRSDTTQNCEINELLSSRRVMLPPGATTSYLNITTDSGEVGAEAVVNKITDMTAVWCFKVDEFQRSTYEGANGTIEHTDNAEYNYPCYFLTGGDDPTAELLAAYMGTLLKDGKIGLSPAQQCRVDFPAMSDITARSECTDSAQWLTPPDW